MVDAENDLQKSTLSTAQPSQNKEDNSGSSSSSDDDSINEHLN